MINSQMRSHQLQSLRWMFSLRHIRLNPILADEIARGVECDAVQNMKVEFLCLATLVLRP